MATDSRANGLLIGAGLSFSKVVMGAGVGRLTNIGDLALAEIVLALVLSGAIWLTGMALIRVLDLLGSPRLSARRSTMRPSPHRGR